jgi:hypothetical protein
MSTYRRWRMHGLAGAALLVAFAALLAPRANAAAYYGEYTLAAKHSGKCLDVAWFTMADGGDVVQSTCSGTTNQTWNLSLVGGWYFQLAAKHSGKCLDVANGSLQHAADVIQWTCNYTDSQLWTPIYVKTVGGVPFYMLENKKSWKCLDVAWFSTADGGNVLQANCTGTDNQLWDLTNLKFGYHGL